MTCGYLEGSLECKEFMSSPVRKAPSHYHL